MTMAGGPLAETHANRRTDYAMVTDDAGRPRERRRLRGVPRADGAASSASCGRVLRDGRYAAVIVRDAYQDGRYLFTGADLAARAAAVGFVPKGDLIWYQAGTRLRPYGYPKASSRTSPTSTSWCCATKSRRAPARRGGGCGVEVGGEDVVVDVGLGHASRISAASARGAGPLRPWASSVRRRSPSVILWSQPRWPSGQRTSQ